MICTKTVLIDHYLEKYSEIEAQVLQNKNHLFFGEVFDYSLVIPVYNECEAFDNLMFSVVAAAKAAKKSILVIAVVNCRRTSSSSVQDCNLELISSWSEKLAGSWCTSNSCRFFQGHWNHLGLLIVDRSSSSYQFQEKQGVGLARKIGSDIATALYKNKKVQNDLVFNTDCDAILPIDFFITELAFKKGKFTLLTPFSYAVGQCQDASHELATLYHKKYLEYYVSGLKFAGSPYAFYTIGSTISFSVEAYAAVRGFSKSKLAGEDFYILNKLAKVGKVWCRESDPIVLEPRFSNRVPFGTGQSIQKIRSNIHDTTKSDVYHPDCFYLLFIWLHVARKLLGSENTNINVQLEIALAIVVGKKDVKSSKIKKIVREDFLDFLFKFNYIVALDRAKKSSKHNLTRVNNFQIWFDAFKTLKFIHQVRDMFCGCISYSEMNTSHFF